MSSVLEDGTSQRRTAWTGDLVPIPDPPLNVVERARLTEALAVDVPLTLVVGPAGTGKTVAVATWAAQHAAEGGALAWVSFDRADLAGAAPWAVIVAALRRCGVLVPARVSLRDAETGDDALPMMLGALVAAHPEPVVLVLDCAGPVPAHLVAGLERVQRRAAGRLRLVIACRTDPPLSLLRHRLAGSVREIRTSDLAFRLDEVSMLLEAAHLDWTDAAIRSLHDGTLGWAAALRFAVLEAPRRGAAESVIDDVTHANGPAGTYLRTEVLDDLEPADRDLLRACCVVETLEPGLVEALAGHGSVRRLERLTEALVDECVDRPGAHRVHPMVRAALAAELAADDHARERALHRTAGRWLATEGRLDEAVHHAVAAGAWTVASRYAIDGDLVTDVVCGTAGPGLVSLFERMPTSAAGPGPSIMRGAAAALRGDLDETAAQVAEARAAPNRWPQAHVALDLLDVVVASGLGAAELAVSAADRAHAAVTRADAAAWIEARRGDALLVLGCTEDAAHAYRVSGVRGDRLALVEALHGRLRVARAVAERAPTAGAPDPCAELALAWADLESDQPEGAREHLRRAGAVPVSSADPVPGVLRAVLVARLRRSAGDLEGARDALALPAPASAWLADLLLVEHGMLDLAGGRPERALARHAMLAEPSGAAGARLLWIARMAEWAGERSRHQPTESASLSTRVEEWLLEASRRLSLGEAGAARRAVQRALSLAAPEHLRRPFREAPADVRRLLEEEGAAASTVFRAVRPATWDVSDADESRRPVLEPLTEKEREVLGHLAAMLSTAEIAGAMFVSVNTVRTHVRNILRKLGASRRNEAVRRARAEHLIPG